MAKFHGKVGFGIQEETKPGVWEDVITEKTYFGDVVRNGRNSREGEKLNNDLSVSNSISIVADSYATNNLFAIKYVEWSGVFWTVTNVEVQRPRLFLQLGEVYNGSLPT